MSIATRAAAVAGALLAVCLAGCGSDVPSTRVAVHRCTAYGVDAIEHHLTVTAVPAACRGLSEAQLDFALGRAIYQVTGRGRHTAAWRRQAAAEGSQLAGMIIQRSSPHVSSAPAVPAPGSSDIVQNDRTLAIITLFSWLVSASSGAFMLGTWLARGGPRQQRARREGLPPPVIIGHFSLAGTGLLLWVTFVATGMDVLAWVAAGLLVPAVGLGISTVTLWTPFPTRRLKPGDDPSGEQEPGHAGSLLASPAEDEIARKLSDEVFASALTDDALAARLTEEVVASARSDPSRAVGKKSRGHLAPLVPALHGMAAITTILFALLTIVSMR